MNGTRKNNASKDYSSSITLVITGEDLDPKVVTDTLSLSANQSWKKGEIRTFPNGREHIYLWGGWKRFATEEETALLLEVQLEVT